jgi:thioredoxin reductase
MASMSNITDVAIIGAGPYGLSLAAHLRAAGLSFRIFGQPLSTWREHMPEGMKLKSNGFASNLSAPAADSTLKAFCALRDIAYHDTDLPVRLDVFNAYAEDFQRRFVPNVEAKDVCVLERKDDLFYLTLGNGEKLVARHVVLAVGISHFADMPKELMHLPRDMRCHSFHFRSGKQFHRRQVAVVGGGASAIDIAAELHACGASVRIVARDKRIKWHTPPTVRRRLAWLMRPASGIGPGWRSFFCAELPQLFRLLPQSLRLRITKRHLGPAPGWFMRPQIEGRVPVMRDAEVVGATMRGHRIGLIVSRRGEEREIACDYVIAATGYKPDMSRLTFLGARLQREIEQVENTPVLSSRFETSVRGLYVVGPAAANSFGPLMRFMVGAEYVSPFLARHLKRKLEHRPGEVLSAGRTLRPA